MTLRSIPQHVLVSFSSLKEHNLALSGCCTTLNCHPSRPKGPVLMISGPEMPSSWPSACRRDTPSTILEPAGAAVELPLRDDFGPGPGSADVEAADSSTGGAIGNMLIALPCIMSPCRRG